MFHGIFWDILSFNLDMGVFHRTLSISQKIVMNLNNVWRLDYVFKFYQLR